MNTTDCRRPACFYPLVLAARVLLLAALTAALLPALGRADDKDPSRSPPAAAGGKRPVILLTGFEPFGEGRPPNSSWQGVKKLNGRQWNGFTLISKELPVVWGAPLDHLQDWIAEHHLVAVFSFGQGGDGAFALESRASNERGGGADNDNQRPPQPTIVADGPPELKATIDYERLRTALSEKGHTVRVSRSAGRYLCEEALYSLEYLRSQKRIEGTVLFCHVPPLGGRVGGQRVDAEFVQQFVEDLLESWYALYQADGVGRDADAAQAQRQNDPREREVEQFIQTYFRTWSDQNIDRYAACFHSEASIQHIDAQGRVSQTALGPFVASQREVHRRATDRTVEVPESIDIRFEAKLARAVVYWKLTSGPRTEYGYDHFTLARQPGGWRIVNLVFYSDPKRAE